MILLSFISILILSINPSNISGWLINTNLIYFVFTNYVGFFAFGRICKRFKILDQTLKPLTSAFLVLIPLIILIIISFCALVEARYWNFEGQFFGAVFLLLFLGISMNVKGVIIDKYLASSVYTVYLYHMVPYQFVLLRIPNYLSIPFTIIFAVIACLFLHGLKVAFSKNKYTKIIALIIGVSR